MSTQSVVHILFRDLAEQDVPVVERPTQIPYPKPISICTLAR
ncbi:hypothetical protein [Vibrio sp. JZG10]